MHYILNHIHRAATFSSAPPVAKYSPFLEKFVAVTEP